MRKYFHPQIKNSVTTYFHSKDVSPFEHTVTTEQKRSHGEIFNAKILNPQRWNFAQSNRHRSQIGNYRHSGTDTFKATITHVGDYRGR